MSTFECGCAVQGAHASNCCNPCYKKECGARGAFEPQWRHAGVAAHISVPARRRRVPNLQSDQPCARRPRHDPERTAPCGVVQAMQRRDAMQARRTVLARTLTHLSVCFQSDCETCLYLCLAATPVPASLRAAPSLQRNGIAKQGHMRTRAACSSQQSQNPHCTAHLWPAICCLHC